MDLSDIGKVANRKRMNADVEKLREKVSRETGNIIKLKVAQDALYWDLREKLQTAERNHERLRGNMLHVQMEHEAASARHQDELRHRPEALCGLAATRAVCDALEGQVGRLRATLQRCAADRTALAAAYEQAAAVVDAARADHERRALAAAATERALRDRVALGAEHAARLAEIATAARREAAEAASEERARLAAEAERLRESRDALAERMARQDALLEERERTIGELRAEMRAAAAEAAARDERCAAELEREAGAAAALREALAGAEARGAATGREAEALRAELEVLRRECEEAQASAEELKRELRSLAEKNEELLRGLNERDQSIRTLEESVSSLRGEVSARAEREARLAAECAEARRERSAAAAAAERELADRAATIARLMRDVAAEAEATARADAALRAARADLAAERERADAAARERQQEIDNIHKVSREPPEHDDNAVAAPPEPGGTFAVPEPRALDAQLYSFLSDGSMDSDAIDPAEVSRRFEALSRGVVLPPTTLRALKIRHNTDQTGEARAASRMFFKNRRPDARHKNKK